jgi:hypothetical protein
MGKISKKIKGEADKEIQNYALTLLYLRQYPNISHITELPE